MAQTSTRPIPRSATGPTTGPARRTPTRRRKVVTTVNLEPAVRSHLDLLMERHDRDRSYVVNALVKRHMRGDTTLDTAPSPSPAAALVPPPLNA